MELEEIDKSSLTADLDEIAPTILKYSAPVWKVLNEKRKAEYFKIVGAISSKSAVKLDLSISSSSIPLRRVLWCSINLSMRASKVDRSAKSATRIALLPTLSS
jgi:hypothetical protein